MMSLPKKADEMTDIINLMDTVKEVDITYDALKDNHDVYINDLREDVVMQSLATEKILQNAVNSNRFVV